jgi:hypothetical protein
MSKNKSVWKKGRGKLGILTPLLGIWKATAESPMGTVTCTRSFKEVLNGTYIELSAVWKFGDKNYLETAFFGTDRNGTVSFWSFTSDGKQSQGHLSDVTDIHPEAVGFEAEMPAGTARMAYWPNDEGGFNWAVESKTKKGWNRFTLHHYSKC